MDTVFTSCTDAAALAAAIAHRCPQARQHGDQWQACCPAHDDHTPSLSITPATDKVLLYCHAQCPLDTILAALDLTRRDSLSTALPLTMLSITTGTAASSRPTTMSMPTGCWSTRPSA